MMNFVGFVLDPVCKSFEIFTIGSRLGPVLPDVLFFCQIWLFFDLVGGKNFRLAGGGFWLFSKYFGGKFGGFLCKI